MSEILKLETQNSNNKSLKGRDEEHTRAVETYLLLRDMQKFNCFGGIEQ